jgi:hypothetical protein
VTLNRKYSIPPKIENLQKNIFNLLIISYYLYRCFHFLLTVTDPELDSLFFILDAVCNSATRCRNPVRLMLCNTVVQMKQLVLTKERKRERGRPSSGFSVPNPTQSSEN